MDTTALFVPLGNDITVTARFPEISDGTGMSSQFWVKPDKTTPDTESHRQTANAGTFLVESV
jgi:hypothetical protein